MDEVASLILAKDQKDEDFQNVIEEAESIPKVQYASLQRRSRAIDTAAYKQV